MSDDNAGTASDSDKKKSSKEDEGKDEEGEGKKSRPRIDHVNAPTGEDEVEVIQPSEEQGEKAGGSDDGGGGGADESVGGEVTKEEEHAEDLLLPASSSVEALVSTSPAPGSSANTTTGLFWMKLCLILGMCICLVTLLLLFFTRFKRRGDEAPQAAAAAVSAASAAAAAWGQRCSWLGALLVPSSVGTVAVASYLYYRYSEEALAGQRRRQNYLNAFKVASVVAAVGIGLGYKRVFRRPAPQTQSFHVSWRLFEYVVLGVIAMSLAKLAFVVTSLKKRKRRRRRSRKASKEKSALSKYYSASKPSTKFLSSTR